MTLFLCLMTLNDPENDLFALEYLVYRITWNQCHLVSLVSLQAQIRHKKECHIGPIQARRENREAFKV